jgi:hypothetical protein
MGMKRLLIQVFERHPLVILPVVSRLEIKKIIGYEVKTDVDFQKMWGRRGSRFLKL